ncbi:MAG TPA: CHASE3 domain-containing protein [Bryobacteraceae bacterium]|nr:CHASE3 domain-containing protein [Bryobacteraceae bacterium]
MRIAAGFGLALLFLLIIGATSYRSTERLVETAQLVSHTHLVLETLESIVARISDCETATRGFVITGMERYLEAYPADSKRAADGLRTLRDLTADNPVQQRRLDDLGRLLESKMNILQLTIDTRKKQTLADTVALVQSGRSKGLMDEIRSTVNLMEAEESRLLKERDQNAKNSAQTLLHVIVYGICIAFVAVALVGLLIHRSITRPLAQFKEFVAKVGEGDLTQRSTVPRGDELGDLAESLNTMVSGLKEVATQTRAATQNLTGAAAEILAAAQQQAASTGEQAAAVQQTNVTMQEISQSGVQISERARQVATAAEATSLASRSGVEAVRNTNLTMEGIRAQAEAVAENVISLSQKTQAVGDIIATVNDIAEQSHLLALNAAIEAAAAGEHGRSFSVVAGEIKNLADQSKTATVQVRSILGDIQRGINSSVMLTEEAVKRVDSGKEQAGVAARTIIDMSENIQQSVQAFQQIVAGTNQQQIGFEQITRAIKEIGQASHQTASSTGQLERAASHLAALGQQLRKSVDRYRT